MTGNLVHFSAGHFLYDVLALGIAGLMIERREYQGFAVLCAMTALAIGGALLLFAPDTNYYGGASGIATAAIVFLALHGLEVGGTYRWVCGAALICVGAKIVAEFAVGRSLFLAQHDSGLVLCPLSHLVGALSALGLYGVRRIGSIPVAGRCSRQIT